MKYWICSKCGLLNSEELIQCENCEQSRILTIGWLQFDSVEEMKKWVKLTRKYMGAKVWWLKKK